MTRKMGSRWFGFVMSLVGLMAVGNGGVAQAEGPRKNNLVYHIFVVHRGNAC